MRLTDWLCQSAGPFLLSPDHQIVRFGLMTLGALHAKIASFDLNDVFLALPFGRSSMFKIIERSDLTEIHLRHVPEGHFYMFRVTIVGGRHLIETGKMAENPHSHTAAYRYARQAREFAAEIASRRDYLLLPLERFASPILVESPAPEDGASDMAARQSQRAQDAPPAEAARPLQTPQDDKASSKFSLIMGILLFVGLLALLHALSR